MQTKPRRIALSAAAALLAIGIAVSGASAQTPPAPDAQDPVIADVVRMLDVGVDPELILEWLQTSGRRPGPLNADDVIALTQAQAPRDLIQALLDMAAEAPVVPPPAQRAPPGFVAPQAPAPAPGPTVADTDCCRVDLSVEYRAAEEVEGDNTAVPERDLFLYLDGEFLARVESIGNIMARGPVGIRTQMAPGLHTLRLTRELHTRSKVLLDDRAWQHETTVSPAIVELQVEPGGEYNLDLRWIQSEFSLKKPLSWRWSRDGMEVAGQKNTGAFREDWAYVCEDAEISLENGAISGWRGRDRLKGCVSWADLWPVGVATSRRDVLAELQQHDFDPPVSYVGRLD